MNNRSFVSGALKLATGAALCTFAFASQADPLSLDATCHLTSISAGAKCQINYSLVDNMTGGPAQVRQDVQELALHAHLAHSGRTRCVAPMRQHGREARHHRGVHYSHARLERRGAERRRV